MSAIARLGIIGAVSALTVWACSSSTEPEPDPIALEEATAMLIGMKLTASQQLEDTTFSSVIHFSEDSIVVRCPEAGQAKLVGGVAERQAGDTARLVTDFVVTPRGCVFTSQGFRFTVDGNPSVRDVTTLAIVESTFDILLEGGATGTLDWELAGRTGTCEVDLVLSGGPSVTTGGEPTFTARYKGTLCGYEVDLDASALVQLTDG